MIKSVLFDSEPSWRENRAGTRQQLPEAVESWVYEPGSLTQRLRDGYGDAVAVALLAQYWRTPFLSERKLLAHPEHRYCLIREVMLHCDGRPLLLARTVIPAQTVKMTSGNLARLGTRPLGEVIFACPALERIAMDVALLKPCEWTPATRAATGIDEPVWGRRTVYALGRPQMLVSEFFLPAIIHV